LFLTLHSFLPTQSLEEILSPSDKFKKKEQERIRALAEKAKKPVSDPAQNALLEALVYAEGGESAGTLKTKREQGQAVVVVIEKLKKDTETSVAPMNLEIGNCNKKITELSEKRSKLLQEIKTIDVEVATVETRRLALEKSVNDTQSTYERTVSRVNPCSFVFHVLVL
jgi:chromosome segregation ATPase